MRLFFSIWQLITWLCVSCSFVASITVIDHDKVVGLPQSVPAGTLGQLYLKYKPYLYVANGCVPFPAVDIEGEVR